MELEPKATRLMRIHFIRHGETDQNIANPSRFGTPDATLTGEGHDSSVDLAMLLRGHRLKPQAIFASPYVRTVETAEILAEGVFFNPRRIITDDRLRELSRGEWSGRIKSEVMTEEVYQELREHPLDFCAPGGESMRVVADRMQMAFHDIVKHLEAINAEHPMAFVVTHGYAIRALYQRFTQCRPDLVWRGVIDNTSITTFLHQPGTGWGIERVNARPHLGW